MENANSLRNKRILVTGGTRGIGKAIVKRLIADEAFVIVNHVRDRESAQALVSEAGEERVTIVRADLTRERGMETLLERLSEEKLDGLVHSAATGVHAPLDELTVRHWDWTMNLNVRAFFELIKGLKLASDASIVALSSEGAVHAFKNYSLVGASKGALESLSRHMAVEFGPLGQRFNILSAGSVLTDAWNAFPDKEQRLLRIREKVPGGELVTPEEVAEVARFLLSNASRGINGQTIVVDKGERIVP